MALAALQVSVTVMAPRTFGTAAWQVPSALATGMTEQVTTGLVVSMTVKVVEQESLLPAASVAVTVMVWTPRPMGTAAWQVPSALAAGMTEQVTTGLVVSMTVKVVDQDSLLPAASVAVSLPARRSTDLSVPAAGL